MHCVITVLEKFSSISCSSICMWINSNSVTVSVSHNNNKTTKSRWQQSNHFVQNLVLQSNIVLINVIVKLVKVKQKGAPREDVSCCWAGNRKCANISSFPICSPWLFNQYFGNRKYFLLHISVPHTVRAQPCRFTLYRWRTEQGRLMT